MNLFLILFIFFISLLIVLISADSFVKYAVKLAYLLNISPLIIGTTIVALGTSLPEFSVAFSSLTQHVPTLSLSTAVGSNILNIGLVSALSFLLFPFKIGTTKTQKNALILLSLTIFFILFQSVTVVSDQSLGYILLFLSGFFITLEIIWGKAGAVNEDYSYLRKNHQRGKKSSPFLIALILFFSLLFLLIGSETLVWSSLKIIERFRFSKEIFGLTVIALGTSLPELITTISAGIKKETKILLGNILGSNVLNLTLIAGFTLASETFDYQGKLSLLFFLFLFSFLFFLIIKIWAGKIVPRLVGFFLIALYLVYFTIAIIPSL